MITFFKIKADRGVLNIYFTWQNKWDHYISLKFCHCNSLWLIIYCFLPCLISIFSNYYSHCRRTIHSYPTPWRLCKEGSRPSWHRCCDILLLRRNTSPTPYKTTSYGIQETILPRSPRDCRVLFWNQLIWQGIHVITWSVNYFRRSWRRNMVWGEFHV